MVDKVIEKINRYSRYCFHGSDLGNPEKLGEDAKELLIENDDLDLLPSDAVVFLMHQGYSFYYFLSSDPEVENLNPTVYFYTETSPHSVSSLGTLDKVINHYIIAAVDGCMYTS